METLSAKCPVCSAHSLTIWASQPDGGKSGYCGHCGFSFGPWASTEIYVKHFVSSTLIRLVALAAEVAEDLERKADRMKTALEVRRVHGEKVLPVTAISWGSFHCPEDQPKAAVKRLRRAAREMIKLAEEIGKEIACAQE